MMPDSRQKTRAARIYPGVALLFAASVMHAAPPCAGCHPKETAAWEKSAMARSSSLVANQPGGSFDHSASGTRFTVTPGAAGMVQSFARKGASESQRVAYTIGSGEHAFGYLVQIGDHLFQSPLSYYSNRRAWDMAPGYENDVQPDFSRPVTAACLLCHSGRAQPVADTLNQYREPAIPEPGITCERCHGSSEAHLHNPGSGSMINPAKLSGAARDSVCEQCHLAGEARVPNPGKALGDFRPGQALEEVYTVYVAPVSSNTDIKVVSHSEQLALSLCARRSRGRLWCGTCHDPHGAAHPEKAFYRDRCLTCHAVTLDSAHAAPGRDCVGCHMPRLPARDGGHTTFTDHRIRRDASGSPAEAAGDSLRAWREPSVAFQLRNRALALVTVGLESRSPQQVIEGYRLLNRLESGFPRDAALLTELGTVLMKGSQPAEAVRRFEKALAARPGYAPYEVNLAAALLQSGRVADARLHAAEALRLDPLLQPALTLRDQLKRLP